MPNSFKCELFEQQLKLFFIPLFILTKCVGQHLDFSLHCDTYSASSIFAYQCDAKPICELFWLRLDVFSGWCTAHSWRGRQS